MFNINFKYLINLLIPPVLRTEKQIAWLEVITYYLKIIYENFILFRINKLYDINFTGQTMYLEKKLQDIFKIPDLYISDGFFVEDTYLSNIHEGNLPVYISNISENEETIIFYNISEINNEFDFVVNIHLSDYLSLSNEDFFKMNKIINYYKLVDKRYKIISYE